MIVSIFGISVPSVKISPIPYTPRQISFFVVPVPRVYVTYN